MVEPLGMVSNGPWWWQAVTNGLWLTCLGLALLSVALLLLAGGATLRLASAERRTRTRLPLSVDADGTATVEFALVFPILLVLALLLTQTTLLMGGNIFVNYAAFAATRAAIVQVPASYLPEEEPNVVINASNHAKHDAIRRAAVFAVLPVSGRIASSGLATDDFVAGLTNYYTAYHQTAPAWINNFAGARLRYADANTLVSLMSTAVSDDGRVVFTDLPEDRAYSFGPREPITVRVTHRLYLSVPYIGMLFATGRLSGEQGSGRYTLVNAQYTLTNEGVYDDLPPRPQLPRQP